MWLSREDSAEAGKYHLDRAPYQKGILEAVSHPNVKRVTLIWASQTGKTLILKIIIGYFMDQEPSPMLYVMPTLMLGRTFSKRRVTPMLRDVKVLKGKVREPRAKDSTNNTLEKTFPGGVLTIVGANSSASLSSNPIRILFADERDKWPFSAGDEGDPFSLALQRTQNFDNRKVLETGTPGIKDISPLEKSWDLSDQEHFLCPCPKCGIYQKLQFGQLKWTKNVEGKAVEVFYECSSCKAKLTEVDKPKMLREGKWVADKPGRDHIGFFLNALYSPWLTWQEFAQGWLDAVHSNNPEVQKQFTNEKLAEWWDDRSIPQVAEHKLWARLEEYEKLPEGVLALTAAADIQDNRIEVLVLGWGIGEEKWHIRHHTIPCKPSTRQAWDELDKEWARLYRHESGIDLQILRACIDTGGHFSDEVYAYAKKRQSRGIYAVKGSNQVGMPIVGKPTTKNRAHVLLFPVGTDTAKELIYAHLAIEKTKEASVPGYVHFRKTDPVECDEEYFKQLTAEKLVTQWLKGKSTRKWVKVRPRNEILDLYVYNYAAFRLLNADMEALSENLKKKAEAQKDEVQEQTPPLRRKKKSRKSNWVNNWKW